jgi:hypothetical protein
MLKNLLLFLRDKKITGAYGVLNFSGDTLRVRLLAMAGRERRELKFPPPGLPASNKNSVDAHTMHIWRYICHKMAYICSYMPFVLKSSKNMLQNVY